MYAVVIICDTLTSELFTCQISTVCENTLSSLKEQEWNEADSVFFVTHNWELVLYNDGCMRNMT